MNILLVGSGGARTCTGLVAFGEPAGVEALCRARACRYRGRGRMRAHRHDGAGCAWSNSRWKSGSIFAVIRPDNPLAAGHCWDSYRGGLHPHARSKQGSRRSGKLKRLCEGSLRRAGNAYRRLWSSLPQPRLPRTYAETLRCFPVVVKADGLAARQKASSLPNALADAAKAIDFMFEGGFRRERARKSSSRSFSEGEEASFFALSRRCARTRIGRRAGSQARLRPRSRAQHRRDGRLFTRARAHPSRRSIRSMEKHHLPHRRRDGGTRNSLCRCPVCWIDGIKNGEPKLIEYNCRWGDPEVSGC